MGVPAFTVGLVDKVGAKRFASVYPAALACAGVCTILFVCCDESDTFSFETPVPVVMK